MHLAGVLASLQVSAAEHGVVDYPGVGTFTVLIRQDGDVQTLQPVAVSSWGKKTKGCSRDGLLGIVGDCGPFCSLMII